MSFTITLHLWWLLAYLAVGLVLHLPVSLLAHRQIPHRGPFWRAMRRVPLRNHLIQIALWPLALWELR